MTRVTTSEITAIEGVEIDIEIRGDEDRVNRAHTELLDHIGRIAAAEEKREPPLDVERDDEHKPMLSLDWESVFEEVDG